MLVIVMATRMIKIHDDASCEYKDIMALNLRCLREFWKASDSLQSLTFSFEIVGGIAAFLLVPPFLVRRVHVYVCNARSCGWMGAWALAWCREGPSRAHVSDVSVGAERNLPTQRQAISSHGARDRGGVWRADSGVHVQRRRAHA